MDQLSSPQECSQSAGPPSEDTLSRLKEENARLRAELEAAQQHLAPFLVPQIQDQKMTGQALEKTNQRLRLLSQTAHELLMSQEPLVLLNHLYERLADQLGLEIYFHFAVTADRERLTLASYSGVSAQVAESLRYLEFGQAVCGAVAERCERIVAENVQQIDDPLTGVVRDLGITAYVCHPLIAHGRLLGTLSFGTRSATSFDQDTLALLGTVCHQIASAIDRKQVEEELRELNQTLEEKVQARTQALQVTNKTLETTRDLFLRIFHANPVAAGIIRLRDGQFVEVNDRCCHFLGYPRNALIGHTTIELGIWLDENLREQFLAELMAKGDLRDVEMRVRTRSGEIRTALVSVEMIEVENEACSLTMLVDITGRIQAEQRIRSLSRDLTLAEQQERRRLSQVLHDDLQQILFSQEMRIHLLELEIASFMASLGEDVAEHQEIAARLQDIKMLVQKAISLTRSLSLELNPPVLKEEGLDAALTWLAAHMAEWHGLDVALTLRKSFTISNPDKRVLLIQLVRELLFNVVKHAGVKQARIEAYEEAGFMIIVVEDEGNGFDVEAVRDGSRPGKSLGLFSVGERLHLFEGRFEIYSRPGYGTRSRIILPREDSPSS